MRLGSRGATLAVAVTAGFAVWATTHFVGPFHSHAHNRDVPEVQLFLAVASLSTLCLVALVNERQTLARNLRASRSRIVEAGQQERARVERDLHDGAQQRLVALQVRLQMARELVGDEDAIRQLDATEKEADAALRELRALAHGIYPPELQDLGLAVALRSFARGSAVPIRVSDEGVGRSSAAVEAAIYFCAREAVQNTAKHAGPAAHAMIALRRHRDVIELTVSDDGAGMPPDTHADGQGITGMRDRIESVGGHFKITSAPGRGTSVHARVRDSTR